MSGSSTAAIAAHVLPEGVSLAEIRLQVEKICASRGFVHSERLSRFLRYAVDHALLGESDQLKEYLLGVEVCDRKNSYDTRIDPIVRVEARRLRSRLAEYYDGEGLNDPILIEFAKGSYAPAFRRAAIHATAPPGPAPAVAHHDSNTAIKLAAGIVAVLAIAAVFLVRIPGSAPDLSSPTPPPSIALLPVVNLSGSDADSYFAQGLTEELISAFAKALQIRVVAPSSLFEVKRMAANLQGGRDSLQVDSVLQCSIRKAGGRVRLTAHLTHAGDGSSIWAETYEREVEDAFAAQEQLAGDIVSAVQHKLLGSSSEPAGGQSVNLEAHNLYLKGRYYWSKRTEEALKIALDCFQQAIAKEKNYAKGYVGLADALATLSNYGVLPPKDSMPRAKEAALKALEIDPELAEARVSLGFVLSLYDWDWKGAEAEFRRALTLRPSYAMGRKWHATAYLLSLGRTDEAITELKRAEELDPLSPVLRTSLSYAFYAAGQYELAVEQSRESLEMHPGFYLEYWNLGLALEQQGKFDEAVTALEKSDTLAEGSPYVLGSLGHAYARAGRTKDAETVLTELKRLAGERYIPPTDLALVEIGLGRTQDVFRWLRKAYSERCTALVSLKIDPRFSPISQEPEFGELLKKMGLELN